MRRVALALLLLLCAAVAGSWAGPGALAGEVPLPPAPAGPSEIEVSFPGYQGFGLQGTLSLPSSVPAGGAPAVLLLPGSGAPDRNGNQQPFFVTNLLKQMAERLAREGFVVLRFDKRSAATYRASFPVDPALLDDFFAWEGFSGDARAAFELLRGRSEVDRGRAAIVGHSEGGLIALQLGSDLTATGSAPAALVLAATAATSIDHVLRFQIARSLDLQRVEEAQRKEYLDALDRGIRSVLETATVPADLPQDLRLLFPPGSMRLWRSYLTLDPLAFAGRYGGPVLLLHGAADLQVPAEEHTAKMLAALAAREGGRQERVVVPEASHNLKRVSGPQDHAFAGDVVPEALDALTAFLQRELAKR